MMADVDAEDRSALLSPDDLAALVGHYDQHFGGQAAMVAMFQPFAPEDIAIYVYSSTPERPYVTLATVGMSAAGKAGRPVFKEAGRWDRAELLMYLPYDWDFDAPLGGTSAGLLRWAAKFPYEANEAIAEGSTLASSETPDPLFPGSLLAAMLFRAPINEEPEFFHLLLPSGAGCHIYWATLITVDELFFARARGANVLTQLLVDANVTELQIDRASVVTDETRRERRARRRLQTRRSRQDPRRPVGELWCDAHPEGCQ